MTKTRNLRDFDLVSKGLQFRKNLQISFKNHKEAENFFIEYLLLECITGKPYSTEDVIETESKLQNFFNENGTQISDLQLPRCNNRKPQENIFYILDNNVCYIKKTPP